MRDCRIRVEVACRELVEDTVARGSPPRVAITGEIDEYECSSVSIKCDLVHVQQAGGAWGSSCPRDLAVGQGVDQR